MEAGLADAACRAIEAANMAGQTVAIIGGGPSLRMFDAADIYGRCRVIVINSSFHLVPWADVLFFADGPWFAANEQAVMAWPRLAVTSCAWAQEAAPDRFVWVPAVGPSSGHTAIAVAVALGAKRILLLGYDMAIRNGASHWHTEYGHRDPATYDRDFLPAFAGWRAATEARGVDVVNCTPHSALAEFRRLSLDKALDQGFW